MALNCGIVGLPNVGKSTLFNALTAAGVDAANYPFCTIEPNVGIVPVPDPRLVAITSIMTTQKVVPTDIEFVDIAGLVAGAAKGEGLGNKFLSHIREVDAILHVLRCFQNPDIVHVSGTVNPASDIDVINTELALADLETVDRALAKSQKNIKSGDKDAVATKELLEQVNACLNQGKPARSLLLDKQQLALLQPFQLLTLKPTLYIANVMEDGFTDNPLLDEVKNIAKQEGAAVVPVCAAIESEIAKLPPQEKLEYLAMFGLTEPGLNRVIRASYALLDLISFFTAGPKEVRAWTIRQGFTAPQGAGCIHTDFEKGFIRAEVIAYDDFIQYHGEEGAKKAGKWRLEGKDYKIQDGDLIYFRFNV